jgi:hypothetical protein
MGENSPNLVTLIFNSKQGVGSKRHTREETGLRSFPTFHHLLFLLLFSRKKVELADCAEAHPTLDDCNKKRKES